LAVQQDRIKSFCAARDWLLSHVYVDDGQSGKDLSRPALQAMLLDIKQGRVDVVVAVQLDRLTRSVKDLGTLVDDALGGASIATCDGAVDSSTASGKLVMNLIGSVAQWEREIISERTAVAMRHCRDVEGRWIGRVPFGFRIDPADGRLREDPEKIGIIRAMKRAHREGKPLSKIAARYGVSSALVWGLVRTDLRIIRAKARYGR